MCDSPSLHFFAFVFFLFKLAELQVYDTSKKIVFTGSRIINIKNSLLIQNLKDCSSIFAVKMNGNIKNKKYIWLAVIFTIFVSFNKI